MLFEQAIANCIPNYTREADSAHGESLAMFGYKDELKIKEQAIKEFWEVNHLSGAPKKIIASPLPRAYRTTSKRRVAMVPGNLQFDRQDSMLEPEEHNKIYDLLFEKLITRCEELGIPNASEDLLKMLLLDFIIANEDRHTYNISFIRETESRKWIGVAPVYDSGKSMFLNKLDFEISMTSSFRIPSKPFAGTQINQFNLLPFEQLYGKIDLEKLSGIDKWYSKLLSKLVRISDDKKAALVEVLMQRITETASLLHKKYEESGVMFIKNGKKSSSQIVLEALQKNPHLTKEELETATNLSRATITRALTDLRSQNKIQRVGSNKTGYWQLSHFPN